MKKLKSETPFLTLRIRVFIIEPPSISKNPFYWAYIYSISSNEAWDFREIRLCYTDKDDASITNPRFWTFENESVTIKEMRMHMMKHATRSWLNKCDST